MQILLSIFIFLASMTGVGGAAEPVSGSVEIGIAELSPSGEVGGYAVPASGCSVPRTSRHSSGIHAGDCVSPTIDADPILLRSGSDTEVSWTTGNWPNCTLSSQLNGPIGSSPEMVTVVNETTFTIDCGPGGSDSVTVYVLPEVEES